MSAIWQTLLNHMSKLVGQQLSPFYGCRFISICRKDNVSPDCVRHCIHRFHRFGRVRIGVHADIAKIMSETWLEERAETSIEGLAWRTQDLVDKGWHS